MAASVTDIELLYRDRFLVFRDGLASISGSREAAREAVQEAFARALRDRRRFRGDGSLEAWVWRIAVNQALKAKREVRARWDADVEVASGDAPQSDAAVREAVRALSPRRRLVVFLRYFADLPYRDIARICGVSEGTVAATLSQSHAELLEHLRAEGASP
jgi:RNA polymerase sigma-70 factor (ECF subfamily)